MKKFSKIKHKGLMEICLQLTIIYGVPITKSFISRAKSSARRANWSVFTWQKNVIFNSLLIPHYKACYETFGSMSDMTENNRFSLNRKGSIIKSILTEIYLHCQNK